MAINFWKNRLFVNIFNFLAIHPIFIPCIGLKKYISLNLFTIYKFFVNSRRIIVFLLKYSLISRNCWY